MFSFAHSKLVSFMALELSVVVIDFHLYSSIRQLYARVTTSRAICNEVCFYFWICFSNEMNVYLSVQGSTPMRDRCAFALNGQQRVLSLSVGNEIPSERDFASNHGYVLHPNGWNLFCIMLSLECDSMCWCVVKVSGDEYRCYLHRHLLWIGLFSQPQKCIMWRVNTVSLTV